MNIILFIFWITLVLYVLLETDAVPKWAALFRLKFFKYEEWETKSGIFGGIDYKTFLSTNYKNFFIYLVTCQECLCVWLNIIGFLIWSKHFGGWSYFGISVIGSLMSIAALKFVLRKFYE